MLEVIQIILGSTFVTFVPGFYLSFVFWSPKEIPWATRILLSFILTIISLPLLVYAGYSLGMDLNFQNILVFATFIIVVSALFAWLKKKLYEH